MMSTQPAVRKVTYVDLVCRCGNSFSLRERDYLNRKENNNGQEPFCSCLCSMKYRGIAKISVACDCGCENVVYLYKKVFERKRAENIKIFYSRDCSKKLKVYIKEIKTIPKIRLCNWCEKMAMYSNNKEGKEWIGSCEGHYLKLSVLMIPEAQLVAKSLAERVRINEQYDGVSLDFGLDGLLNSILQGGIEVGNCDEW